MVVYLLFGNTSKRDIENKSQILYKIFSNKISAENYKKEAEREEPEVKFSIEEWVVDES